MKSEHTLTTRITQSTVLTWEDGDGPEINQQGRPSRIFKMHLTYEWDADKECWRADTVWWSRWILKDGGLGKDSHKSWYGERRTPEIQGLVEACWPITTKINVEFS